MSKKVLIFAISYYPKPVGGAEVAIREITNRMQHDDIEFHLITNRFDSDVPRVEQVDNVTVHRIGITKRNPSPEAMRSFPLHLNKLLFQFTAYLYAKKLHQKHHFDAMWAMMAHACAVPAGLFKKQFPNVSYVLTLQEGDPPEYIENKMRVFGPLFKNGFVRADKLQTISTFLEKWGRRMGFAKESFVIPNAVDVERFGATDEEAVQQAQDEIQKKGGETWLVHTGRYVHKNGLDDVVRSLDLLPETVRLLLIGEGPDEEALQALAHKLGLSHRVLFKPYIDNQKLPAYLKACDIFIRPSRSEGMGNSFVEAMAAGLPVIATQEGGIADFLFDRNKNPNMPSTGFAVSPDSPDEIAQQVRFIMDNPSEVHAITSCAKDMVSEKYTWDSVAKQMRECIFKNI